MKHYKLEIEACEDEDGNPEFPGVEGYIKIKVPSAADRFKIMKESGITGEEHNLELALKMMEKVNEYVEAIDVKKGDLHINDIDELGYYDFGTQLITKVNVVVNSGIPTGKI